jgi:murein L,D-transpeptidase YafK
MANYFRIWSLIGTLAWGMMGVSVSAQPTSFINPEQVIEQVIQDIKDQRNHDALTRLDTLIERYPDFQLAQLIRADLLYAKGSLLENMGNFTKEETLSGLKSEVLARINAVKFPPDNKLPASVLSLPSWLKHLVLVSLSDSRAYLFNLHQGQLRFVTSYYITQGKLGAGKEKEGDKRTPIGAYFLGSHIDRSRLSPFYGIGAVPLQYPNSWDRSNNRTGHGIWFHGTPIGQYSRPPKASDGCMVFTNDDLAQILTLDWRNSLVITDKNIQWLSTEHYLSAQKESLSLLSAWRSAWEKQDLKTYLSFYSPNFTGGEGETIREWTAKKTQIFSYNRPHKIELSDILLIPYPNEPDVMVTIMTQKYVRDGKESVERKRLWWRKNDQGKWQIFSELVINNNSF